MQRKEGSGESLLGKALNHPLSRRTFVKAGCGAAAGAVVASRLLFDKKEAQAATLAPPDATEIDAAVDVRYSVCLSCHGKCGIAVRVKDDTVLKIDGNPWHPNCVESGQRLPFDAPLDAGLTQPGTICPKGQSGVEVMYNPLRLQQPLKRVGARGAGKWEAISWDQALTEIAAKLAPFYEGYAAGQNIDGKAVLGSIANQVVFAPGRIQHGQKELTDRVFKMGFGTVNSRHDHTSICETTHHIAGRFTGENVKYHFKPDMLESKYIIWFGSNPSEANFPAQTLARRVAIGRNAGVKHVIVDPRHSRSCAFAHKWLPVKVNGDAALAMGMARRIIEQGSYDVPFLEAANNQAALATADWNATPKAKQYNATDASWLVVVSASSSDDAWIYLRDGSSYVVVDPETGARGPLDRAAAAAARWGKIELDGTEPGAVAASSVGLQGVGATVIDLGDGRYAAPVFQLYRARVESHSMAYYAKHSGIDAATIVEVADEFAAAGRKAVATAYRGACQKTGGMAAMQAILNLNSLVGNWDWKGGNLGGTGGHLHEMGGSAAGQLDLAGKATTKRSPKGPQITRVKSFLDSTVAAALGESLDAPTRRPWFPWAANGNYQELVPSFEDQYPYPVGAFISYWNNTPYSTPAAKATALKVLSDETLVPLHVCFDIEMSEMASLADYVLPDGSYFERWATPHNSPTLLSNFSGFRSPVVGYYAKKGYWQALAAGTLDQWNYIIDWKKDTGPFTIEDITLELVRRVAGGDLSAVPSLGANAYYSSHAELVAAGVSPLMRNELRTAWDWYWNILVNFAIEAGVSPLDEAGIKDKVKRIVERGGWFQDTTDAAGSSINEYDGDYVKAKSKVSSKGASLHLFYEYAYPASHPDRPGKRYRDPYSLETYDPLPEVVGTVDAKGKAVVDSSDFPFYVVTYKPIWHSQGRTDSLPSLRVLEPENAVEMNTADARALDLWTGDQVRLTSASNSLGVTGTVKVTERIRPGVVAVSHSRGRWDNGGKAYAVGGVQVASDPGRGRGINTNQILRLDPALGNVTLQEPIGGSASFSDTRVKVAKVTV